MLIFGNAVFEAGAPPFQDADLVIRLEDTSLADAPAHVVAQTVLHGVSWRGDPAQTQPFTMTVPDSLATRSRYELRIHLDRARSGEVSRGDFITTQSHPVKLVSPSTELHVPLRWLPS